MAICLPTSYNWLKRGENILAVKKMSEGTVLKKDKMFCARICDHTLLTFKVEIVIVMSSDI